MPEVCPWKDPDEAELISDRFPVTSFRAHVASNRFIVKLTCFALTVTARAFFRVGAERHLERCRTACGGGFAGKVSVTA